MLKTGKTGRRSLVIFLALFYSLVFFILLKNSFGYLDPDFGWHLMAGKEIWQERAVPHINHENFPVYGQEWVDHEWLMNLITYFIYSGFGYVGLSFFFAFLVVLVLLLQLRLIRKDFLKNDRGLGLALSLQFFGVFASLPHLGVRMQEVTLLGLVLLITILLRYEKKKEPALLFWLIPLFLFWASAHAGFLIGLFLLALFAAVKFLEWWASRRFSWPVENEKVISPKELKVFCLFSFFAFLATLLTPYGLGLYDFLRGYGDSFYQRHIEEWFGQHFFPFQYPQLAFLELVLIFLFFPILQRLALKERKPVPAWPWLLNALFFFLAFKSRRHFPLLFIVSVPFLSSFFIASFSWAIAWAKVFWERNLALRKSVIFFGAVALLLVSASNLAAVKFTTFPEKSFRDNYPYEAVKFLRAHPEYDKLNLFNHYSWGGYLIWQYPERQIFIDGRMPQLKYGERTFLEEYFDFFDKKKAEEKLKEHHIGLVLMPAEKSRSVKVLWWEKVFLGVSPAAVNKQKNPEWTINGFLKDSPNWELVYEDETSQIYARMLK